MQQQRSGILVHYSSTTQTHGERIASLRVRITHCFLPIGDIVCPGVTLRSQEVHRSEKSEKKSGKTGFPGSGSGFPDLRACRCDWGRKGYLQPKFQTSSSYGSREYPLKTIIISINSKLTHILTWPQYIDCV